MTTFIVAVLVFGILVLFHEFGHFSVAKLVGIKVHEFAIGMGPKIISYKGQETRYSVRILPIGGYVKMEGEDEKSSDERSFNNKPLWARLGVIIAGPLMNFVLAVIVFSTISYSVGFATTVVAEATKDLPAYKAGLKSGDKIIAINDKKVRTWDEIVKNISESKDDIKISYERNDKSEHVYITPAVNKEDNRRIIGISPKIEKSIIKSIENSFDRIIFIIGEMFSFFSRLFGGKASASEVVGPVGIIHLVGEAAKTNIYNVLFLTGLISINLGMVNLLPIPALDGGRIIFLLFEAINGKPLDPDKEGMIHFTGFVLLMGLMIFMVWKDLGRFVF
ncbi:MAG: RIP metalloprotease RseP [Anaeromicrobium sp.]|jgi:regulator of sigma E protease|uniref:RIP metalloprotease RseP n=1 Tax=Anaeromicrobium sp. TaxID=1929132 RepID=UPI0025DF2E6E|nr:RIP metalloprotease RseP [Anaeromicrobium sp.]MCT4595621.1 RIP metalloprotease RseP [Anaeromicrobium sp.]